MFLFSDDPLFTDEELFLMCAASGGKTVQDTATGNPLTFITDKAKPLKSLLIPFSPRQDGSGDPSPQNIRSILPWNGLKVWHGGKNLIDDSKKYQHSTTTVYIGENSAERNIFLKAGKYTVTRDFGGKTIGLYYVKRDSSTEKTIFNAVSTDLTKTITIAEDGYYAIFCYRSGSSGGVTVSDVISVMIEVGETATAYEPYEPITETDISFPSPVYGGTLDVVSGVLTVEWVLMSKKWSEWEFGEALTNVTRKTLTLPQQQELYVQMGEGNSKTNVTNVYLNSNSSDTVHYYINQRGNVLYAFLPNDLDGGTVVQFSAKLITPYEVQLTGEQLTALVGDNTIWSDADGSMTAVYLKKG